MPDESQPSPRPRPWWRHPVFWIAVIVVGGFAGAVGAALWTRPRLTAELVERCRARYAEARTAADSVAADEWQPFLTPGRRAREGQAVTCAVVRRSGHLD
jgi:hypothetical protein